MILLAIMILKNIQMLTLNHDFLHLLKKLTIEYFDLYINVNHIILIILTLYRKDEHKKKI